LPLVVASCPNQEIVEAGEVVILEEVERNGYRWRGNRARKTSTENERSGNS